MAHIDSGEPLRADGLTTAINGALTDAGCQMHDLDFRITDVSGEQYYFKEAALALSRILRQRKEEFDIWHPAECIGEAGAAAGIAVLADANAACRKAYAAGSEYPRAPGQRQGSSRGCRAASSAAPCEQRGLRQHDGGLVQGSEPERPFAHFPTSASRRRRRPLRLPACRSRIPTQVWRRTVPTDRPRSRSPAKK